MILNCCLELAGLADKDGRYPLHYLALRGLGNKQVACLLHSFPSTDKSSKKEGKIFVVRNEGCWDRSDEDGGSGCIGYIEEESKGDYVRVRWLANDNVGFYKFGFENQWEVVKCVDDKRNNWLCKSCSNSNSAESVDCEECNQKKVMADDINDSSYMDERKKVRSKSLAWISPSSEERSNGSKRLNRLSIDISEMESTPYKYTLDNDASYSPASSFSTREGLLRNLSSEDLGEAAVQSEAINITMIKRVCALFPEACGKTDRRGRLALHYACRNNVPMDIFRVIFERYF